MAIIIPLRSDLPNFDLQVDLEGVTYTLSFYWNTRETSWYMDIKTDEGEPIVSSIKFLIDFPLGRRSSNPLRPPGAFIAQDSSGQRLDPTYDPEIGKGDLGDRVQLLYFESTELPIDPSGA